MTTTADDEMQELLTSIVWGVRNPKTRNTIKIKIAKGQHSYLVFHRQGNDYCYTPHPDADGWYYSFIYVGVGAGSRSGQAKRFTMKKLACHRQRRAAKSRALRMRDQIKSQEKKP